MDRGFPVASCVQPVASSSRNSLPFQNPLERVKQHWDIIPCPDEAVNQTGGCCGMRKRRAGDHRIKPPLRRWLFFPNSIGVVMKSLRIALLEHKERNGGWYGVDLDGTLADHKTGDDIDGIGAPIQPMIDFVKQMLSEGKEVRVFTARVNGEDPGENECQRKMIADWTVKQFDQELMVTHEKDPSMIAVYDDREIQVIKNTGEIVEP